MLQARGHKPLRIPNSKIERFVRELVEQCLSSQQDRINRGMAYKNYYLLGADGTNAPALYNKTYAYIDDLGSLLYSPVSLKYHIGVPDLPNALSQAKGRAASTHLHTRVRKSDTDTLIEEAVTWSLVKGKSFVKQKWGRGEFSPDLIQPEMMGVLHENRTKLDEDMEAFVHSTYITPYQFRRMIWNHPDKDDLLKKMKRYVKPGKGGITDTDQAMKQVIIGGLYPFQPQAGSNPSNTRGIVDWMGAPTPTLAPQVMHSLVRLDELWVWNDEKEDWCTFQQIGEDMLIMGKYRLLNALAYNPSSQLEVPELKGFHPFVDFCPNRSDGYFWGRSEIANVALLQEAMNSRTVGINSLLRRQEDPPTKFIGSAGVNQNTLSRYRKPGGYWTDTNPNAKVEVETPQIPADLWNSIHEYERMFDEMGGLPPIAKGRGEAGVRSQGHAETLVRMFSPRFKDRALLVERDVEALGGLMLQIARVHIDKKLIAWLPEQYAGVEKKAEADPFLISPAPGLVPVEFSFADLDDDMSVTVDSHSASPAFMADARALAFDLLKIGAMSPAEVVERSDVSNPDELVANIERRQAEKAAEIAKLESSEQLKLLQGGKKK